jgi:hypothetical protein
MDVPTVVSREEWLLARKGAASAASGNVRLPSATDDHADRR